METLNPFKGPQPYSFKDSIPGRQKEIDDLYDYINHCTLTLLYSKSGVGKTSILQAGIVPELEKSIEFCPAFIPIYIRFNSISLFTIDHIKSLITETIQRYQTEHEDKCEISYNCKEANDSQSLFEFLYTLELNGQEKKSNLTKDDKLNTFPIIPVLIFDQFEEIFTILSDCNHQATLLDELEFLLEDKIPDSFKIKLKEESKGAINFLSRITKKIASKDKPFRIVFSFREEYLTEFESLKEKIPTIIYTKGRYRLEGFSKEESIKIIEQISSNVFDESLANNLCDLIISSSFEKSSKEANGKCISPFILSLICFKLYPEIAAENTPEHKNLTETNKKESHILLRVRTKDTGLIQGIIQSYYEEVFSGVSAKTKKFIEENLVTKDNKRTPFPFNSLKAIFEVKEGETSNLFEEINLLTQPEKRYLNTNEYLNSPHVEVLHDQLIPPLVKSRDERIEKERREAEEARLQTERAIIDEERKLERAKRKKKTNKLIIIASLGILIALFGSYFYNSNQIYAEIAKNKEPQIINNIEKNYGTVPAYLEAESFLKLTKPIFEFNFFTRDLKERVNGIVQEAYKKEPFYFVIDTTRIPNKYRSHISPNGEFAVYIKPNLDTLSILNLKTLTESTRTFNSKDSIFNYNYNLNIPRIMTGNDYFITVDNNNLTINSYKNSKLNFSKKLDGGPAPAEISFSIDEKNIILAYSDLVKPKAFKYEIIPISNADKSFVLKTESSEKILDVKKENDNCYSIFYEVIKGNNTEVEREVYKKEYSVNSRESKKIQTFVDINTTQFLNLQYTKSKNNRFIFHRKDTLHTWKVLDLSLIDPETDINVTNDFQKPYLVIKNPRNEISILNLNSFLQVVKKNGKREIFRINPINKSDQALNFHENFQLHEANYTVDSTWLYMTYLNKRGGQGFYYLGLLNLSSYEFYFNTMPLETSLPIYVPLVLDSCAIVITKDPAPSFIWFFKKSESFKNRWNGLIPEQYKYQPDELRGMGVGIKDEIFNK